MGTIKGYKGFDKDMKCRGFQYEPGKTYEHDGQVKACSSGFHFCENPLDVFNYYSPSSSRFFEVDGGGEISKHGDDSKVACSKLHVGAELNLTDLTTSAIKFVMERVKVDKTDTKAHNAGHRSAASNTGDYSAASNTGDYSAASNTGHRSAAMSIGVNSSAEVSGEESCAISLGINGKAKANKGSFITLAEWKEIDGKWHRISVKSVKVDGEKIKADTWYILKRGKFVGAK